MICLRNVKRFCKEYWKIENYDQAMADTTQTWHCHHIHEIEYNLSKIELQAMGFYFNCPSYELIFLTPEEHNRLHGVGRYLSEETKNKIKGNQNGLKYHITAEELNDLYRVQGLSQKQIAELYGCSLKCIHHKLKKYNISKHGK